MNGNPVPAGVDAGVVDQNVDASEPAQDLFGDLSHLNGIGDVSNHFQARFPANRDLLSGFARIVCIDVDNDHSRPVLGQNGDNGPPDARGSAGDDGNLFRQVDFHKFRTPLKIILVVLVSVRPAKTRPASERVDT